MGFVRTEKVKARATSLHRRHDRSHPCCCRPPHRHRELTSACSCLPWPAAQRSASPPSSVATVAADFVSKRPVVGVVRRGDAAGVAEAAGAGVAAAGAGEEGAAAGCEGPEDDGVSVIDFLSNAKWILVPATKTSTAKSSHRDLWKFLASVPTSLATPSATPWTLSALFEVSPEHALDLDLSSPGRWSASKSALSGPSVPWPTYPLPIPRPKSTS